MDKTVDYMTVKDFQKVPDRTWMEDIGEFASLVIIPAQPKFWNVLKHRIIKYFCEKFNIQYDGYPNHLHDSGYRKMDFCAIDQNNKPICLLSGCSDVIHIDGIGGYGYRDFDEIKIFLPEFIKRKAWSIDCLKESGYLRIFCEGTLKAGPALSSFELYGMVQKDEKK